MKEARTVKQGADHRCADKTNVYSTTRTLLVGDVNNRWQVHQWRTDACRRMVSRDPGSSSPNSGNKCLLVRPRNAAIFRRAPPSKSVWEDFTYHCVVVLFKHLYAPVLWSFDNKVSGLESTRDQNSGLGLETLHQDQDQDLIQWQGCTHTYLSFLNCPMFTSDISVKFICAKLAAAWIPTNFDTTAVDVDKSASTCWSLLVAEQSAG